ncbi:MAG: hypothetical protein ABI457_13250 [Hyphomicrobium sp.]
MGKNDNVRDIEAALKRAAEAAKKGGRDARSGRFLDTTRLASASKRSDHNAAKK